MNQQQRKYAKERIESLVLERLGAINKKHTAPAVTLTKEQRFKAFKKGEYKIKPGVKPEISNYTAVSDIIDFNGERKSASNHIKINEITKKINLEHQKIMDELMLGDCEKALELIKKFESKTF